MIINGHNWSVYLVQEQDPRLRRPDGLLTLGATNVKLRQICISEGLTREITAQVLRHELTHAFINEYGVKFGPKTEEKVADFIATFAPEIFKISEEILTTI